MRSLNRVTLLGNIGRDAEVKHTANGTSVANFSLATERRWKDKNSDEWKSETDWHRITAWRMDGVAPYLLKGKSVLVEGRLQTRSYEKDGSKVYVTEVVADNIILLGGGKDGDSSARQGGGEATATYQVPQINDDDIPF